MTCRMALAQTAFLVAFILFFPLSLFAQTLSEFNYYVQIPATSQTCDQEAQNLASRFKQATTLEVIHSQCVDKLVIKTGGKA